MFYCDWFGGDRSQSLMRRRRTGCELQIDCGCEWYHLEEDVLDDDTGDAVIGGMKGEGGREGSSD